jgi:hypothetical protein
MIAHLLFMIIPHKDVVENTEENHEICRKYCTKCPSYKNNSLGKYQPAELFCACGKSSAPEIKEGGCFCPACELFTKNHLHFGYFCSKQ